MAGLSPNFWRGGRSSVFRGRGRGGRHEDDWCTLWQMLHEAVSGRHMSSDAHFLQRACTQGWPTVYAWIAFVVEKSHTGTVIRMIIA
jgi:hypothetical protein